MKKKYQSTVFILLLIFKVTNAQFDYPVSTMKIPYAPIPFTIDCIDNEAHWSAEKTTDLYNHTGCNGSDTADFQLTFRVAYDMNYLYVFAKILDDINNSIDSIGDPNPWTYDNVELFMDLDTTGSELISAYDTNTYQVRFNRGIDSVGSIFGRDCKRSDHKYAWKNTDNGWTLEVALAWKFVLGHGQKTEDIISYIDGTIRSGFEITGADSDSDGPDSRDCQATWDYDECLNSDRIEDCSWNDRTIFGVVTFEPPYTSNINDLYSDLQTIYPNPTNGTVSFKGINSSSLKIFNLTGREILTTEIINNQADLSILEKGIYIAKTGQYVIKILKY